MPITTIKNLELSRLKNHSKPIVMHFYEGYHFGGMHLIWWLIWIIVIVWIFATPWDIPGQRKQKDSPLEILQKRYAGGAISKEEYEERKAILERDSAQ